MAKGRDPDKAWHYSQPGTSVSIGCWHNGPGKQNKARFSCTYLKGGKRNNKVDHTLPALLPLIYLLQKAADQLLAWDQADLEVEKLQRQTQEQTKQSI